MVLHWVLGRQHMKGSRQLISDVVDGDGGIGHGLKQGRLRLRARAVDLIGKHNVGKQRSFFEAQRSFARVKNRNADEVRRQQISRELYARKSNPEHASQGPRQRGFAHAGNVF